MEGKEEAADNGATSVVIQQEEEVKNEKQESENEKEKHQESEINKNEHDESKNECETSQASEEVAKEIGSESKDKESGGEEGRKMGGWVSRKRERKPRGVDTPPSSGISPAGSLINPTLSTTTQIPTIPSAEAVVQERTIKIVAIGDGSCGAKTSLLKRWVTDAPYDGTLDATEPTLQATYVREIRQSNLLIKLQLEDTSGQEEFEHLRQQCYKDADVVLLGYSVANPASFENTVGRWLPEVRKYSAQVPVILVGAKVDLYRPTLEGSPPKSKYLAYIHCPKREGFISPEDATQMKDRVQAVAQYQVSNLTGEGVGELLEFILSQSLHSKHKDKHVLGSAIRKLNLFHSTEKEKSKREEKVSNNNAEIEDKDKTKEEKRRMLLNARGWKFNSNGGANEDKEEQQEKGENSKQQQIEEESKGSGETTATTKNKKKAKSPNLSPSPSSDALDLPTFNSTKKKKNKWKIASDLWEKKDKIVGKQKKDEGGPLSPRKEMPTSPRSEGIATSSSSSSSVPTMPLSPRKELPPRPIIESPKKEGSGITIIENYVTKTEDTTTTTTTPTTQQDTTTPTTTTKEEEESKIEEGEGREEVKKKKKVSISIEEKEDKEQQQQQRWQFPKEKRMTVLHDMAIPEHREEPARPSVMYGKKLPLSFYELEPLIAPTRKPTISSSTSSSSSDDDGDDDDEDDDDDSESDGEISIPELSELHGFNLVLQEREKEKEKEKVEKEKEKEKPKAATRVTIRRFGKRGGEMILLPESESELFRLATEKLILPSAATATATKFVGMRAPPPIEAKISFSLIRDGDVLCFTTPEDETLFD